MIPVIRSSQKLLFLFVFGFGTTITQASFAEQPAPGSFRCGVDQGSPATLVEHPVRGTIVFIRWSSDYFSGSGWTPERRCRAVSPRFQSNKENQTLDYIISGTLNGLPVLCGSSSNGGTCSDKTLLFTLKRQSDADTAIKEIVRLNKDTKADPLNQSTDALEVGRNGSLVINVDKLIRNGTTSQQNQSQTSPSTQGSSHVSCNTGFIGRCH